MKKNSIPTLAITGCILFFSFNVKGATTLHSFVKQSCRSTQRIISTFPVNPEIAQITQHISDPAQKEQAEFALKKAISNSTKEYENLNFYMDPDNSKAERHVREAYQRAVKNNLDTFASPEDKSKFSDLSKRFEEARRHLNNLSDIAAGIGLHNPSVPATLTRTRKHELVQEEITNQGLDFDTISDQHLEELETLVSHRFTEQQKGNLPEATGNWHQLFSSSPLGLQIPPGRTLDAALAQQLTLKAISAKANAHNAIQTTIIRMISSFCS